MAFDSITGGSGGTIGQRQQATPGSFRNVYGFDNAPDNTNLPDVYDEEVGRYGDRTINNFLRMVSAEYPTVSQQIQWGEEGRLNVFANRAVRASATAKLFTIHTNDTATLVSSGANATTNTNHGFRIGDKVIVGDAATSILGYVSDVSGADVTIESYLTTNSDAGFPSLASGSGAANAVNILVVGNESGKGSDSRQATLQPEYTRYTNNTTVIRDTYSINASDQNQIGWLKSNGSYYWYTKGNSDTAQRFENMIEMTMVEDQPASATGNAATVSSRTGSTGLFHAIQNGGNIADGGFTDSGTASDGLSDFDEIVTQLDKEGAIEENGLWLDQAQSLNVDDILASQNSYGSGGSSWGLFNNDETMGLNLGFKSWTRGSYDFYKTTWKYLNQTDGRGSFQNIQGVSVPMGMKNIYGEDGGKISMPFLHVKYLMGPSGSRKMVQWAHGGTPDGGFTDGVDATSVEYLTERALCTTGRNNFFLFTA